jgi:hypothetical protein
MESIGDCYAVILNNPELRKGLIRDTERSHRTSPTANSTRVLRRWFALALHGLAFRVDPALRTLDLRLAPTSRIEQVTSWFPVQNSTQEAG